MKFQAVFIITIRHAGIANTEGDITLINGTIGAEFTRTRVGKLFAIDEKVDVVYVFTGNVEGTDGDGVGRDGATIKNDILSRDDVALVGGIVESENP